jgi:phospholipid/cholesterol/gamma-HCH transport system permease protein
MAARTRCSDGVTLQIPKARSADCSRAAISCCLVWRNAAKADEFMPTTITSAGSAINHSLEWVGELGVFVSRIVRAVVSRPFEGRELIRQIDEMGSKSLPLVVLAGGAIGAVISFESRDSLVRFGAKSMLPAAVVFAIIHEMGPIVTGLVVSGRVGAGIGAELGSMKVTEQIDAIEASAVNPYNFLAAPRILACILVLPLLTLAADFCAVIMAWVADTLADPISFHQFIHGGFGYFGFNDFLPPTFKTAFFGLIIGLVACFQGMKTQGGTAGVGRTATSSVVLSSLFVILADVILAKAIVVFFP